MPRKKQFSILIAQQEDYERERMASLLNKGAVEVHEARDGREALQLADKRCPDILVTDLALDKLDGVELMRRVRESCPDVKVVLACAQCSPRLLTRAVELGVDGFVPLPADAAKLKSAVSRCAREIAATRRMAEADYSLKQLMDFFTTPAVLVNGYEITHINKRFAVYLGYGSHEAMADVDIGLEDFIVRLGDDAYDGHPTRWLREIVDDQLDRDHIVHVENPRHPASRANAFSVTFNQFPGSELRLFTFQDVSGLEDERARLEDEASTDPLTKALNRRSFLARLSRMTASGNPFSLVMFDIDHFKSINDTYGHDVGDAVLREIAQLVRDNIRETDVLARWGGEEFMVLCGNSTMQRTRRVAQRLRGAVENFAFTGVPRQVTSSFGVVVHEPGESGDEMVKRADTALYEAKETGRNKVVVG